MKYCIIDVGSNSVRLMTWADGTTLYKKICTTRLGEGIAQAPVLREAAMERTARAVAEFAAAAREEGVRPYAFATAAVRTAKNGGEFCARVKNLCGVELDVVSGEREAELALAGALGKKDGSVVDIGGASTEICTRKNGVRGFAASLDIGAVRLYDLCGDVAPRLEAAVSKALSSVGSVRLPEKVYAVGGTATTLAALMLGLGAYDAEKINDFPMDEGEVGRLACKLAALDRGGRAALRGMDPKRADIIVGGAMLLHGLMKKFGLGRIYASDRDNLEGYLYQKVL